MGLGFGRFKFEGVGFRGLGLRAAIRFRVHGLGPRI